MFFNLKCKLNLDGIFFFQTKTKNLMSFAKKWLRYDHIYHQIKWYRKNLSKINVRFLRLKYSIKSVSNLAKSNVEIFFDLTFLLVCPGHMTTDYRINILLFSFFFFFFFLSFFGRRFWHSLNKLKFEMIMFIITVLW